MLTSGCRSRARLVAHRPASISMTRRRRLISSKAAGDSSRRQRPAVRVPARLSPPRRVSPVARRHGQRRLGIWHLAADAASVIRISTHPRIYLRPSRLDEAVAFCGAILEPAHCTVVQPGARHWPIFLSLCASASASGNLVQDAWFAALVVESGCEWITTDRGYAPVHRSAVAQAILIETLDSRSVQIERSAGRRLLEFDEFVRIM